MNEMIFVSLVRKYISVRFAKCADILCLLVIRAQIYITYYRSYNEILRIDIDLSKDFLHYSSGATLWVSECNFHTAHSNVAHWVSLNLNRIDCNSDNPSVFSNAIHVSHIGYFLIYSVWTKSEISSPRTLISLSVHYWQQTHSEKNNICTKDIDAWASLHVCKVLFSICCHHHRLFS